MTSSWLLLAQEARPQEPGMGFFFQFMLIMLAFMVLFVWLPARRQRKQHDQMLNELKRNDKVVTSGGIVGYVAEIGKDDEAGLVTLKFNLGDGAGMRIRVLKSAITQVLPAKEAAAVENQPAGK